MTSVDGLPGDQRAVLQLVLGRRRSYDEIARLLSIDPSAVRERALAALDALGPQTPGSPEHRAQIGDYLLGQLPEDEVDAVRDRLATSPGDRAWARVLSSELAPVAAGPLPEIPVESGSPAPAAAAVTGDAVKTTETAAEGEPRRRRGLRRRRPPPPPSSAHEPGEAPGTAPGPRSSRLGGAIVIAVAILIVVVVVVVIVSSGGSKKPAVASTTSSTASTSAAAAAAPTSTAATPSTPPASTTSSTATSSAAAKVVAQINLTPPTAGSKIAGIAEVLKEGATNGIAIVAQNVPPNTTEPPNAYAVWLYNSPTDAKILGFVNPAVGATGKLSTAGGLPTDAAHYKELIVTVETSASPKVPGTIVLQGMLTGV